MAGILDSMNIEQQHFFEERFAERHNTVCFSFANGITLGECLCGELFFIHTEMPWSAQKALKTIWRAHAKGGSK